MVWTPRTALPTSVDDPQQIPRRIGIGRDRARGASFRPVHRQSKRTTHLADPPKDPQARGIQRVPEYIQEFRGQFSLELVPCRHGDIAVHPMARGMRSHGGALARGKVFRTWSRRNRTRQQAERNRLRAREGGFPLEWVKRILGCSQPNWSTEVGTASDRWIEWASARVFERVDMVFIAPKSEDAGENVGALGVTIVEVPYGSWVPPDILRFQPS
ncbi:hypothetical protein B0H13DRAFT_1885660 [Mycena leptocephala]|nr:hypothetical protein B0H13DRAFT_1885660 [Mycena leptocephala]